MQILKNNTNISHSEFAELFPREAIFLAEHHLQLDCYKGVVLVIEGNKISLSYNEFSPVSIEISKTLEYHQKYFYKNSFYKDPLARAIGLKKGKAKPILLDASAGFMGDSLLMYSYGLESLICIERNPVAALLISNALSLLKTQINIKFYYGDLSLTPGLLERYENIDVVFFDPMYKEKNIKTAPKKEMKIFRSIIGEDTDSKDFAMLLRNIAKDRLVIKRPSRASAILPGADHTISGKSTSYDVYLALSLK